MRYTKNYTANGFTAFRWRMREEEKFKRSGERSGVDRRRSRLRDPELARVWARFIARLASNVQRHQQYVARRRDVVDDAATSATLGLLPGLRRESQASFTIPPPEQAEEAVLLLTRPKRLRSGRGSGGILRETERVKAREDLHFGTGTSREVVVVEKSKCSPQISGECSALSVSLPTQKYIINKYVWGLSHLCYAGSSGLALS